MFDKQELERIEYAALDAAKKMRGTGLSSGNEREADALEALARKARGLQRRTPVFVGDSDHEKDDRIL